MSREVMQQAALACAAKLDAAADALAAFSMACIECEDGSAPRGADDSRTLLARAQGFGDSYLLEAPHLGRALPKHAQVRMIGNSVCPPLSEALVRANYTERQALRKAA